MTKISRQRAAPHQAQIAYERSDVDPQAAWSALGAVAATLALVCLSVAGLFALFGGIRQPAPSVPVATTAAPALQVDERHDRAAIEARAEARLRRDDRGIAIDEAMRRTATAGWDSTP